MKQTNLAEFSDILYTAQKVGYSWNTAHDILVKDGIVPMYECNTLDHDLSDFGDSNPYGYTADTIKIMKAFFAENNVTTFTLTKD